MISGRRTDNEHPLEGRSRETLKILVGILAFATAALGAYTALLTLQATRTAAQRDEAEVVASEASNSLAGIEDELAAAQSQVSTLTRQNERLEKDKRALESELAAGDVGDPPVPATTDVDRNAIDVNWETSATDFDGEIGMQIGYSCPSSGIPQTIYGTDLYTTDSSVCTAAVHAGLITLEDGGDVVIRIRERAQGFLASDRNGITSSEFQGSWSSFEFMR